MTTEIATKFSLEPANFQEAIEYAKMISRSSFCPKQFMGKPEDVLIAIQMGNEVGLKPIQALQNIAVINGRPSVWGDAALAVCMNHPAFESIQEYMEGDTAVCVVKRKGMEAHVATFSKEDAVKAGLWGKQGPWMNYPHRMLQMRARGFALRDKFADALKGLITAEEAQDYPKEKDVTPKVHAEEKPKVIEVQDIQRFTKICEDFALVSNREDWQKIVNGIVEGNFSDEEKARLRELAKDAKSRIETNEFRDELDQGENNADID